MKIRKMQTASGGPLRIKFTPEQIALFESYVTRVPGMNNSGGNRYREEGVLALRHLEQEAKRKEEEIKSRMEMRPTLKRKVTTAERLQGKKDEYELTPQIVGMSGADPLLSFYVGGVGLNGIGALAKTGLWNVAKYAPTTQLGNWGRGYFVGNAFKNSFNGTVPTLASQATSLLYLPAKLNESGLTSLKFFERKPSKNNIVGTSLDYSMKDSKGMDFIKQFFALLRINGKEYTLEGLKDAANVQQGLPEHIQSYLNLNTVERAARAMRKNGYSEREIQLYIDKVNEEMNKVKVGMYSNEEYNAAGALDFGGFYNNDLNFISVNKDAYLSNPKFTSNYILKHEGRHLIDYNTSMTDDVINILEKAYDKDFLEIPKHKDAGNLKNYLHMDRERVTTNRDARDVLLSNLEKHPGEFLNLTKFAQTSPGKYKDMVDFLNELILYAEPEDIINAVENSNGYGKRYINYLKKNDKLTSTKIEQLRLAMIHVPSYLLPITGGYTLYNLFNQPLQQLQYQKQGGKMNILEFLKKGSGIHIKEKNKGSFTRWCGGEVTDECIRKGKNSSNPKIRKKATFADNARHFKHLYGGVFQGEFNLSPIVLLLMMWLQQLPDILLKKKELKDKEIELERLKIQLLSDILSTIMGTAKDVGLSFLSKKFGKNESNI